MLIYSSKQSPSKLLDPFTCLLNCFAGNHNIPICTVYIPPNPNVAYFNLLVDFLNSFSQSDELFITVGDLNQPDICWLS